MANSGPSPRADGASSLSPPVASARLGFAIILVVTFVWGAWTSAERLFGFLPAQGPALGELLLTHAVWMPAFGVFLSATATPAALAFLLLVRAEALRPTARARAIATAGSVAGVAVAAAGLGTGILWAGVAISGPLWGFLAAATVPVGLGSVLLVSSAALRDRGSAQRLRPYAVAIAMAVMAAAVVMGSRVYSLATYAPLPSVIVTAAWPAGVGLLLLVTSEDVRSSSRLSGWGVLASGLLAAAGLGAAIWFAVEVHRLFEALFGYADRSNPWITVQLALLPVGIASLSAIVAFGLKGREVWAGTLRLGWTAAGVLAVAAVSLAVKRATDVDENHVWTFIGVLVTPLAIAATVAVAAQRRRQPWA